MVLSNDFGTFGEPIERTELTLDGPPALRWVVAVTNGHQLAYVVGLDGSLPTEGSTDRYLVATTMYGDESFERDSALLDEVFIGFTRFGQ